MHVHRDLLRKARAYHAMPASVAKAMEEKEVEIDRKLIEMGPWVDLLQLPKMFMPNLTSKPWHGILLLFLPLIVSLITKMTYLRY